MLDAQILADVYLTMTGGQTSMKFSMENESQQTQGEAGIQRVVRQASRLRVVLASDEELLDHESRLDLVQRRAAAVSGVPEKRRNACKIIVWAIFAANDSKREKKR